LAILVSIRVAVAIAMFVVAVVAWIRAWAIRITTLASALASFAFLGALAAPLALLGALAAPLALLGALRALAVSRRVVSWGRIVTWWWWVVPWSATNVSGVAVALVAIVFPAVIFQFRGRALAASSLAFT
jgi:hypothetical protein